MLDQAKIPWVHNEKDRTWTRMFAVRWALVIEKQLGFISTHNLNGSMTFEGKVVLSGIKADDLEDCKKKTEQAAREYLEVTLAAL